MERYQDGKEDTMSNDESAKGVLRDNAVVDFTHLRSPEELSSVSRIEDVGAVIVPESLAAAYAAIPASDVGATLYVPDGVNVRVHTGTLTVGGDGLGAAEDVLVVVGMLIITSPVTGVVPKRMAVIGSVLAPRGSEPALGPALAGGVGSVSYYRYAEGQDIRLLTGQVKLSGAMLANPAGQPDDILVAVGQVVVSGPVTTVGYAQVIVVGQFMASEASRDVLEPRMQMLGQVAWYRSDDPRMIFEDTRFGPDFFRLLDNPVSLLVLGDLSIAPDVTESMVREKVTDIVLFGDVTAPAELVGLLQVLVTDAYGTIRAAGGPGS
jgi:hypothetical protein